jgi:hypothetical protein
MAFYHDVSTVGEAKVIIDREAAIQLKDPAVGCNVFGLEIYHAVGSETGWEEWEDDNGYSIDDAMNADDDDAASGTG